MGQQQRPPVPKSGRRGGHEIPDLDIHQRLPLGLLYLGGKGKKSEGWSFRVCEQYYCATLWARGRWKGECLLESCADTVATYSLWPPEVVGAQRSQTRAYTSRGQRQHRQSSTDGRHRLNTNKTEKRKKKESSRRRTSDLLAGSSFKPNQGRDKMHFVAASLKLENTRSTGLVSRYVGPEVSDFRTWCMRRPASE